MAVLFLLSQGDADPGMVQTWTGLDSVYSWPLGVAIMVLGPISMVSGYLLLAGRRRRPALLASLGWLVIDALYFLETGQPFVLGFWLLPLPFLLWGSWAGRPARSRS